MFGTSPEYHGLNAGAHRNVPTNVVLPALTWHLAFWVRPKQLGSIVNNDIDVSEDDNPIDNQSYKASIDSLFINLFRSLRHERNTSARIMPNINGHILLFDSVFDDKTFAAVNDVNLSKREGDIFRSQTRSIGINFDWNGLSVTIRCEIHTEYITLTTFIEIKKRGKDVFRSFIDDYNFSNDKDFNRNIKDMHYYLHEGGAADVTIRRCREYFFRDIWVQLENDIFSLESVKPLYKEIPFTEVFGDFRGIIIQDELLNGSIDLVTNRMIKPSSKADINWGYDAKRLLLPLLKMPEDVRVRNYECIANYMIDGRALYMSTLAPQLPEVGDEARIPVEFILYVKSHDLAKNKRQCGRAINYLHHLETLRLAALKDVSSLHAAGKGLSELDTKLQRARRAIYSGTSELAMNKITKAHLAINTVTGEFLRDTNYSLQYRIQRSSFYVQQSRRFVPYLRIERLEGSQMYHQYVERRVGHEFEYIERLGARYERAISAMIALDQNYLSMNTAMLSFEANNTADSIKKIQEWGEFALLGALVPYYITHILEFILIREYMPSSAVVIWTFGVMVAFYRKLSDKNTRKPSGIVIKRWLVPAIIAAIVLILSVVHLKFGVDFSDVLRFPDRENSQLSSKKEKLSIGPVGSLTTPTARGATDGETAAGSKGELPSSELKTPASAPAPPDQPQKPIGEMRR